MVDSGLLDWAGVADRMSYRPARIGRARGQGEALRPGNPANIALLDPDTHVVVEPATFASKGRNSPYTGMSLPGRVVATFLRGEPTVLDGKLTGRSAPHELGAMGPTGAPGGGEEVSATHEC